jgi:hypothetical protein
MLLLAFQQYDNLEQLSKALDDLHDSAYQQIAALSDGLDHDQPVSHEQLQQLAEVAVIGVLNAERMLGIIRQGILKDNPGYAHVPRKHWAESPSTAVVVPPTRMVGQVLLLATDPRPQLG